MTVWREFLAFVDGSEDGLARMRMAMDVAAKHKGRLEALVLVELPLPDLAVASETLEGMFDDAYRKVRTAGANAVTALNIIAKEAKVEVNVSSWEIPGGQARDAAARAARTADLVIFGKPETLDDSDLDTDIFVGATMEGGRPWPDAAALDQAARLGQAGASSRGRARLKLRAPCKPLSRS
ncbi:MAG: hypothetical protein WDM79_12730 [Terricaulis sp.]